MDFKMVPFLLPFRRSTLPDSKYQLFNHSSIPSEFKEGHSPKFHRTYFSDCIKSELLFRSISSPTKISQFGNSKAKQYILWFQITMKYTFRMTILQSLNHLPSIVSNFLLFHLNNNEHTSLTK